MATVDSRVWTSHFVTHGSKDPSISMQWLRSQQRVSAVRTGQKNSFGNGHGVQEHAVNEAETIAADGPEDRSPLSSDHSSHRTQRSSSSKSSSGGSNVRPPALQVPKPLKDKNSLRREISNGSDGQAKTRRRKSSLAKRRDSEETEDGTAGHRLAHRFCPWDGTEFRVTDVKCPVCGSERKRSPYSGVSVVLQQLLLPAWERVLWKRQPYEDNYTDRTFLESLITNANFSEYDFWRIVRDSVVVAQHLSATVVFLAMFYHTNYEKVQLRWMLFVDVLLGAAGFGAMILIYLYQSWSESGLPSWTAFLVKTAKGMTSETAVFMCAKYARACFLFLTAIYTLSPILRTLTQTISDDTVAAMTISFLTLHLFTHDYRFVNGRDTPFGGSVSLNAAMFVSVLLSSRSTSNLHVALLIICAVEIFALAPRVFRQIRLTSETASITTTVLFFLSALALLNKLNVLIAWTFSLVVFSITFVCPLTFMYIQRYKNSINGPWDEAVPTNKNDKMGR